MNKQIIPAILTQDVEELKDKLTSVDGETTWVQVDIMDGQFVDNYSIDLSDLQGLNLKSKISAHLMVANPESFIDECKQAGVAQVIFHIESTDKPYELIKKIDEAGMEKGIALNPETPIAAVKDLLHRVNVVLLMGVNPGRSSQKFIPEVLDKIVELKKLVPEKLIIIDGGITKNNIKQISEAGARGFVVGTEIFYYMDRKQAVRDLKKKLNLK